MQQIATLLLHLQRGAPDLLHAGYSEFQTLEALGVRIYLFRARNL
jgi:hypothetical protein